MVVRGFPRRGDPLAWTQADIDALKTAIATGIKTVRYSGPPAREITYQDMAAMERALAKMTEEVTAAAGTRRRYRLAATRTGFDS